MSRALRRGLAALLAAGALVAARAAAEPVAAPETPEQVTLQYFEALKQGGLARAPRFLHPEELAKFKEMLLPLYRAEAAAGKDELARATLGEGASLATVEGADAQAFATGLLGLLAGRADGLGGLQFDRIEIVGRIEETPELVHVLARTTVSVGEVSVTDLEVISFRPHGDSWRMLLSGEMQGLARALRASVGE